ncbi:hypothetical protein D3C78_1102500 [compost metagenome]
MPHLDLAHAGEGDRADAPIQPGQLVVDQLQRLIDQPDLIVARQAHQLPALARTLADQQHQRPAAEPLDTQTRGAPLALGGQAETGVVVRIAGLGLDLAGLGQRAQQAIDLAGRRRITGLGGHDPAGLTAFDAHRRQLAVADRQRTHLVQTPAQRRQQQLPLGLERRLGAALQPGKQPAQRQRDQQQHPQRLALHGNLLGHGEHSRPPQGGLGRRP